jgi:phosphoribosyl-ATP pyrophosphohydrolase
MIKPQLFRKIIKLVEKDPGNLYMLTGKTQEELGEFVAALFKDDGYKITDETQEEIRFNMLEEGVDMMIATLGVLIKKGFELEEIAEMFKLKTDKWAKNIGLEVIKLTGYDGVKIETYIGEAVGTKYGDYFTIKSWDPETQMLTFEETDKSLHSSRISFG